MKRFATVALALAVGLAVPAFAQRGGGGHGGGGGFGGGHMGGGFGGHSSSGFRGGFSSPRSGGFAPRGFSNRFAAPRTYNPYGPAAHYYGRGNQYAPNMGYRSGFRAPYSAFRGSRGFRDRDDRFRNRFGSRGLFVPDWIGIGPYGCYDDSFVYNDWDNDEFGPDCYGYGYGYDDQLPLQGDQGPPVIYDEDNGYTGAPNGYGTPPPPPDYVPPGYEPPAQRPKPAPMNDIATTIVFKDGRPSEQIHNYALTQTNLYVMDQERRDIPLDQIDLAATEKANRAVGVEFQVPQTAQ
jgi:hypothetical protein